MTGGSHVVAEAFDGFARVAHQVVGEPWVRGAAVVAVMALVGAACGGSHGGTTTGTTAGGGVTTPTTTAPNVVKFGTLDSPCGKGTATGATATGVTDTSITIGYGDDAGYSAAPGLDKEMSDAVKPMIKWCNDQGGINGRKIVGKYYDAQVLQVTQAMTQACNDKVFMLVGQGFVLDAEPGDDAHRLQAVDDPRLRGRHGVRERLGHAAAHPQPRRRRGGLVRLPGRQAVPRRGEEGRVRLRRLPRHHRDPRQGGRRLPEGGLEVPQLRPALQHRGRVRLEAVRQPT